MERFSPDAVLAEHGIRLSRQRIAIFKFLAEHPTHPTAEDVYQALYRQIRTLSRTTVYNTLRLFCSRGAAQMITLEENEMRFDAKTEPHGHFKCTSCGKIFDFSCAPMLPSAMNSLPAGFSPRETQLYVRGLCRDCCASGKESAAA